ncbi:MAG TPA: sulfite exporter TauE/SafE family protein, partial [Candidatus Saccharimonadales bacterium]
LLHFRLRRHLHSKAKQPKSLLPMSLALLPMMIYGGYFGPGFGFMMLAFLGFTKLHEIHQMNALKNVAGSVIALVSIACLFSAHRINWHYGLVMGTGNFAGGYLGVRLTERVSSHALRIVVIVIGLGTATYLGLRSY